MAALRPESPSRIDLVLLIAGFSVVAVGATLLFEWRFVAGVAAIVVGGIVAVIGAYLGSG
ncbi:MAG TPA: hypothetical protein VEK13_00365 [Thermoplasmata archaeon]|jgi:hypothetical protein|nr:hypothetical protein [Thermoplasmata archaeon]